jgi:hypothetical protein
VLTQQEIDAAELEVERTENALDAAEAHHERAGSEKSLQEVKAARFAAHGARDRLRSLRARWAAERAAEARRAQAEANFPKKRREALAQQLGDARDEAAHAVAMLDKAAAEALRLVAEYGATVREASAELMAAGLRAGDGGEDGGTAGGTVHLAGEAWRAADPLGVLEYLLAVRVAVENPSHPLAMRRYSTESLAGKAAREDLLKAAER